MDTKTRSGSVGGTGDAHESWSAAAGESYVPPSLFFETKATGDVPHPNVSPTAKKQKTAEAEGEAEAEAEGEGEGDTEAVKRPRVKPNLDLLATPSLDRAPNARR